MMRYCSVQSAGGFEGRGLDFRTINIELLDHDERRSGSCVPCDSVPYESSLFDSVPFASMPFASIVGVSPSVSAAAWAFARGNWFSVPPYFS